MNHLCFSSCNTKWTNRARTLTPLPTVSDAWVCLSRSLKALDRGLLFRQGISPTTTHCHTQQSSMRRQWIGFRWYFFLWKDSGYITFYTKYKSTQSTQRSYKRTPVCTHQCKSSCWSVANCISTFAVPPGSRQKQWTVQVLLLFASAPMCACLRVCSRTNTHQD